MRTYLNKSGFAALLIIIVLFVGGFSVWALRQPPAMTLEWAPANATPNLEAFERAADQANSSDAKATAELLGLAQPLARTGNARAQFVLGLHFADGIGGQYRPNYCQAARWFEQGARQTDIFTMLFLSVMLATGQGVQQDLRLASTLLGLVRRHPQRVDNALGITIQWVERTLAARDARFADSAYGETITNDYRALGLTEMPRIVIPPSIDIPVIGPAFTQAFYKSSGCHESVPDGVLALFNVLDMDESRHKIIELPTQESTTQE
jgi:hypothetical protein